MADKPGGGHEVPRTISHYTIGETLGGGGMGTVYRGIDRRDDSPVAIKLLHPHLAEDESFRERFEREAHVGALLRSPYVVRLLDYGFAEGRYFLVMEYVEGLTLKDEIAKAPLPPVRALKIAAQVARALEEAEARGVVHRDIKPDNILIGDRDNAKVADFGIAKQLAAGTLTMPGAFVGTLFYAAPELALGKADNRSDIYSLGATLFHTLTGHPPFRGDALEVLRAHAETPVPMEQLEGMPDPVREIIAKCLQKEPEARYQSTTQLAGDLEKAASHLAQDEEATTIAAPPPVETVVEPPAEELAAATEVVTPPPPPPPPPPEPEPQPVAPTPEPEPSASTPPPPPPPRPMPPPRKRGMPSWLPAAGVGLVVAVIAVGALVFLGTLGGGDDDGGGDGPSMIGRDALRRMLLPQDELGPDYAAFTLNPDASGYVTSSFGGPVACPSTETVTPPPAPVESYDSQYEWEQSLLAEVGTFIFAQGVDHHTDDAALSPALDNFLANPIDHVTMPGCPDNEILESDDFDPVELASAAVPVPTAPAGGDLPAGGDDAPTQPAVSGDAQPDEEIELGTANGGVEQVIRQTDADGNEQEFTVTAVAFLRDNILGKILILHFDSPDHQTQASQLALKLDARIQAVLEEITPTPAATEGSATPTSSGATPTPTASAGPTTSGGATATGGPTSTAAGDKAPVIVSIGCSPTSVKPNETVSCSPSISGSVTSRTWSASGGSPSSGSGSTFSTSFSSTGQKVITLQACNGSACAASQAGISVSSAATAAPTAPSISSVGCSPTSVSTNQTVTCNPSISGTVTSRSWTASGGSPSSGTGSSFSTSYSSSGSKTITLQACNGSACSSKSQNITVSAPATTAPPTGDYVVSVTDGVFYIEDTITVDIYVSAPSAGLGYFDIDFFYDPNVIYAMSCSAVYGECDEFYDFDDVIFFGTANQSGDFYLGSITFGAVDAGTSDLVPEPYDMEDIVGNDVWINSYGISGQIGVYEFIY